MQISRIGFVIVLLASHSIRSFTESISMWDTAEALLTQIDNETAICAINLFTITGAQHRAIYDEYTPHWLHLQTHDYNHTPSKLFTWTYPTVHNVRTAYDANRGTEMRSINILSSLCPSSHVCQYLLRCEHNVIYVCVTPATMEIGASVTHKRI